MLPLGAKLASTAVVARLFQLTQPTLMRIAWFALGYPRWKAWKGGGHAAPVARPAARRLKRGRARFVAGR